MRWRNSTDPILSGCALTVSGSVTMYKVASNAGRGFEHLTAGTTRARVYELISFLIN